jgi:hypothetical protein
LNQKGALMENYKERIKALLDLTIEGKIKWKIIKDETTKKDFQWVKLAAKHEDQATTIEAFFDINPKENPSDPSDIAKGTDAILTFQTGETFHLSVVEKLNPSTKKIEIDSVSGILDVFKLFIYAYIFALSPD